MLALAWIGVLCLVALVIVMLWDIWQVSLAILFSIAMLMFFTWSIHTVVLSFK